MWKDSKIFNKYKGFFENSLGAWDSGPFPDLTFVALDVGPAIDANGLIPNYDK